MRDQRIQMKLEGASLEDFARTPMYNPHISLFNKVMFNTFTFTVPCLSKITVKTILRVCSTVLSSVLFIKIFGWIADFF